MSYEKCFYHEELECLEDATYIFSFFRDAGILVGSAKTRETYLVCQKHKKQLVSDFKAVHRLLKIEAGSYKAKKMRS